MIFYHILSDQEMSLPSSEKDSLCQSQDIAVSLLLAVPKILKKWTQK